MIAAKLIEENPLWEYTGKQCENKFKDVRKMYTKTRDNNVNKSGQDLQTCKFYEEMDAVFGEKLIIKPEAIDSNLEKRSACAFLSSEDEEERENIENKTDKKTEKPKKKSKVSKELEKLALLQQEAATVREQAKERRHEERMRHQAEAIKAYETAMNKLLEKF